MGSGVSRVKTGSFNGTAALLEVRTVGFRPSRVELKNVGGLTEGDWHKDMADDEMIVHVTAGDMTLVTSGGIIPLSDGFSIGSNADVNGSGELVHWTAYE